MIGVGDGKFSVMSVVSLHGLVIVSSISYFSYVGSSSKISHSSLFIYLGERRIQEYSKKKRGRKKKIIR